MSLASELYAILNEEIEWQGDLEDDCSARWRGYGAHAEAMDVAPNEWWYFSVWKYVEDPAEPDESIAHSTDMGVSAASGEAARRLCQTIMRNAVAWEAVRAALDGEKNEGQT